MSSQVTGLSEQPVREAQTTAPPPTLRRRSQLEIWMFLVPAILFQLAWGWYPLVMGIIISFTDGAVADNPNYVGFANYVHMITDPVVGDSLRITYLYSGLQILLTFVIPIFVAILIMEMPKRVTFTMLFLWFIPVSGITSLILMRYFYDPSYGLFQFVFTQILHLPAQKFLDDSNMVLFWLVFPSILFFGPGTLYMATLQGIPGSYFEAAEVEGAGFWRKIWTITLPRLRPVIYLTLFLAIVASLQPFDGPKILTNGGPPGGIAGSSYTVMMYVYDLITNKLRYADASALASIIFFISLAMGIVFRAIFKEDPDV